MAHAAALRGKQNSSLAVKSSGVISTQVTGGTARAKQTACDDFVAEEVNKDTKRQGP